MKAKMIFMALLAVFLAFACQKKNSTEPADENIHPQQDIPWPSLADSPWPCALGDMQGTARSKFSGPKDGIIKWSFTDSLFRNSASAPVIGSDGTIYFVAEYNFSGYRLYAVSKDGILKWTFTFDDDAISTPIIGTDDIIYVACCSAFYAINPDGSIKWKYQFPSSACVANFSNAIGLDGTIYFTATDGFLYALNPNGTLKWKSRGNNGLKSEIYDAIVISPDGNYIYVAGLDTSLNAINTQTGSVLWQYSLNGNFTFLKALVDNEGNIYFIKKDKTKYNYYIVSLTAQGTFRWQSEHPAFPYSPLTIDYQGNLYFKYADSLCSIDYSGNTRWCELARIGDAQISAFSLLCDKENNIYVPLTSDYILCFDNTGNMKGNYEIPDTWTGLIIGGIDKNRNLYVCGKYKLIIIK